MAATVMLRTGFQEPASSDHLIPDWPEQLTWSLTSAYYSECSVGGVRRGGAQHAAMTDADLTAIVRCLFVAADPMTSRTSMTSAWPSTVPRRQQDRCGAYVDNCGPARTDAGGVMGLPGPVVGANP